MNNTSAAVTQRFSRLLAIVALIGMGATVRADEAPAFPSDPNAWINSGPLSTSGLKGKGIVLYFFEEDCPKCRAKWPELLTEAKEFEGKPVVFIAVNSGSPRAKIQGYVQQVKLPWPVLLDTSREFEKACGLFAEISLQNIYQYRYITPDGEIHQVSTSELTDIAEQAAEGAEWKVDPRTIPDSLKPVWNGVEVGNYKAVAGTLKKSAGSSKADVKEAAAKLMEVVQTEIDGQIAKIKEAQDAGNPYKAFELYSQLADQFAGFELPKDIAALKKDLPKDPKVKAGQAAAKQLEVIRKQLMGGNAAAKAKSTTALEKIVADFPETNLAQQAQSLIDSAK